MVKYKFRLLVSAISCITVNSECIEQLSLRCSYRFLIIIIPLLLTLCLNRLVLTPFKHSFLDKDV